MSIDPAWRVTTETETREFNEVPTADVIVEMAGFHQTSTGCMGGCVAVPAFRKQRTDGFVSVRIETVVPTETSGRDSSAYLHAVDVASKAI